MYCTLSTSPQRYSRLGMKAYMMIACVCALLASTIGTPGL